MLKFDVGRHQELTEFQVGVDFARDDGYGWVHAKSLHETSLEILHFEGILESHGPITVTEDVVELLNDFLLNVRVAAHH